MNPSNNALNFNVSYNGKRNQFKAKKSRLHFKLDRNIIIVINIDERKK